AGKLIARTNFNDKEDPLADWTTNMSQAQQGYFGKSAQWVAPALHKVLSTISGPVGMIHPAIGGALGAGANLAGAFDRLVNKR
ncbi:MAG: hypothetical protein EZS28_044572, partial [Streblomastix strix]